MDAYEVPMNGLVVGFATALPGGLVVGLRRETRSALARFGTEVRDDIAVLRTETHDELRAALRPDADRARAGGPAEDGRRVARARG